MAEHLKIMNKRMVLLNPVSHTHILFSYFVILFRNLLISKNCKLKMINKMKISSNKMKTRSSKQQSMNLKLNKIRTKTRQKMIILTQEQVRFHYLQIKLQPPMLHNLKEKFKLSNPRRNTLFLHRILVQKVAQI